MSKYFLIVVFLISCRMYSQDLLNSDFIKLEAPSKSDLLYILEIDSSMKAFNEDYGTTINEYFQTYGNIDSFQYDYIITINFLKKFYYGDYNLIVKRFAAFKISDFLMTMIKIEETDLMFAYDCLKLLKADDNVWSLNPEAVLYFNNLNTNLALKSYIKIKNKNITEWNQEEKEDFNNILINNYLSFGNKLYQKNPDRKVRAYALIYIIQMLNSLDRKDIASEYYYKLSNEFSDIENVKETLIEYNPSGNLIPGKPVPPFQADLLNSKNKISSELLKGKCYLIYFWATWCAPCIMKMEKLHQVFEKYKDSNFTILAFSLDNSDEIVQKFHKEKWQMPWFNVRLKDGFEDDIAKIFELTNSVPKMLLVDSNGIIVEDNSSIKENIEDTISKYISKK